MEFVQLLILGLGSGSLYAVAALGIVVIYRGSGIVNFSQGAIGMAAAYVFFEVQKAGANLGFALLAAIAAAGVIGCVVQTVIIRPMRHAASLQRVIATLGVLIVLQWIAVLRYGTDIRLTPSVLPQKFVHAGSIAIPTDRLFILLGTVLLTVGLDLFYRFSSFGRATTAVQENELLAASIGYSPNKLAAINWTLGGVLAGLAGSFLAPITGLEPSALTLLVVPALAAALIGNFTSFPLTVLGALLLGVLEVESTRYINQPGIGHGVPLLIIIAMLVIRGRALPVRGVILERLPRVGSPRLRPIPLLVSVVISGVMLYDGLNISWVEGAGVSLQWAIIGLSVVVVTGYAGQVSLAQYALAGMGAFVAGRLVATQGMSTELAVVIGVVVTIPIGVLVGLPALRTRGVNLAVVTMALGYVIQSVIFENPHYTGGTPGTVIGSPSIFGMDIDGVLYPQRYAVLSLIVFVLCALLVINLRRSSTGRRLIAVRENERAAAAIGINVSYAKLYAFAISAGLAALGGIVLTFRFTSIAFSEFTPFQSIFTIAMVVLGGVGYVLGALTGGLALAPGGTGAVIGNYFGDGVEKYLPLAGGVFVILMLRFHPDGLGSDVARFGRLIDRTLGPVQRSFKRVVPVSTLFRRRDTALAAAHFDFKDEDITPVEPASLHVAGVSVRYGGVVALDDVSVTVRPGEIVSLIGPNGAGKTTLIDAITGFATPKTGTVSIDQTDITHWSAGRRARFGLSRSFQSLELFEDMTVADNVRTAAEAVERRTGLRDLIFPRTKALSPSAVAAVSVFGLQDALGQRPSELPYGRRRLVAVARAVAAAPSVLLLDEPAGGLDEDERAELGELVRKLARRFGVAVLIIEHDLEMIMRISDRITVLDFGRMIATGTPEEIRNNPAVVAAYIGETDEGESLEDVLESHPLGVRE